MDEANWSLSLWSRGENILVLYLHLLTSPAPDWDYSILRDYLSINSVLSGCSHTAIVAKLQTPRPPCITSAHHRSMHACTQPCSCEHDCRNARAPF